MLGQPISMLVPEVLGVKLTGTLPGGATATDLVLTVTERLRKHGVVGKFVEFFGPGLEHLSIADRATLGNMCPEYGATIAVFPIDRMTLDYLRLTGRDERRLALVEGYAKAQGLFWTPGAPEADYAERIEVDLEDRRAEPGRAAAAPGPRDARQGRGVVRGGARHHAGRPGDVGQARRGEAGGRSGRCRRPGSRGRGDCRDHQLHEHVEPERDDWRRPAREEGGRARPAGEAVGEDEPGAWVEGRDAVPDTGRTDAVSRSPRVPAGGLRVHDLHRQQRPADAGRRSRGEGARPGRRLGAERQPELRGAHPVAGAGQLPRVAPAGGGLRAGRHDARST